MNIIITYVAKLGTFISAFIFIWTLHSELTSTYVNGGCLYKLARFALLFISAVACAICHRYGW